LTQLLDQTAKCHRPLSV